MNIQNDVLVAMGSIKGVINEWFQLGVCQNSITMGTKTVHSYRGKPILIFLALWEPVSLAGPKVAVCRKFPWQNFGMFPWNPESLCIYLLKVLNFLGNLGFAQFTFSQTEIPATKHDLIPPLPFEIQGCPPYIQCLVWVGNISSPLLDFPNGWWCLPWS